MIRTEFLDGGVAWLEIDTPGSVNTLGAEFNREFAETVERLVADDAVKGIVIASAKDGFAAGGDLDQLRAAATPEAVMEVVQPFLDALRRLETGGKPVVAALNGTALGGGFELALGAHARIAADRPDALFGLPEATLGLLPGAGGTQRLPRLIGLKAGGEMILKGSALSPAEAHKAGIVDKLVPPADLRAACLEWIAENPNPSQPWDRKGFKLPGFDPHSPEGRHFFLTQWAKVRSRSGGNARAASAILHILHHGLERGLDAGIAIESRHFSRLAASPEAKNIIRTQFYGPRAARRAGPKEKAPISLLGVIGGGTMGCGIAYSAARAGIEVVLLDVSEESAAASGKRIAAIAERAVSRGRLTQDKADAILARVSTGADYQRIADADLAIEAVFERIDIKHDVLRRAEAALRPGVPIASNTSSIPIGQLATALSDPSRLIGMHFFAPVETMKLLEVIRTPDTSEQAFAVAMSLSARLRKIAIVVNDGLGFYTSRLVSSLSSEAMTLIAEGVPPQLIDNVATSAGFAVGAATLADLTKLDLLRDIMETMSGPGSPKSMKGTRALEALTKLVEAGRTGRASGAGLYDYGEDGARPWSGLGELFPAAKQIDAETARRRLVNTQSLEAVRALEEGVLADPLSGDTAAVFGWGYPLHLGGPFAYIDMVGAAAFVEECEELAARFGERFEPPALLVETAREGKRFHPV